MQRNLTTLLVLGLVGSMLAAAPNAALATPITGGTGPGGIGTTDGSSLLKLWLKADSLSQADSTPVTSWTDSSGSGNNVTDDGNAPTYKTSLVNSRPGVQFDGVDDVLQTATDPASLQITTGSVYVVGAVRTSSGFNSAINYIDDYGAGRNGYWLGNRGPNAAWMLADGTGYQEKFNIAGSWPASTAGIIGMHFDGSNVTTRAAGSQVDSTAQTKSPTYAAGQRLLLSRRDNTVTTTSPLDISEAIVINQPLNSAQTAILENYLSAKYDLTIANNHYDGDTGGLGDYDLDVFGIGRVDSSNEVLNSGSAGFGIEATGGTLGDNEWVLAGHKTAANSIVDETGGLKRWDRVWYVDKTATDGVDATLSFDFSDGGVSPPGGFVFSLLFSTTNAFSFSTLAVTPVISGDTVSFAVPNALLADGYYTLGLASVPEPATCALVALGLLPLLGRRRGRRPDRS